MDIELAIDRAVKNIAKFGDTDVFPFLFERHIFFDRAEETKQILLDMHANFDVWLNERTPSTHESLAQVGYTGFRWATQIEPWWNAYYLALVIYLADQIEAIRIPASEQTVFSYRYEWSDVDFKLFADSSWNDYRSRSVDLCKKSSFVVTTDISDFYPRIYHHRIENQLNRLPRPSGVPQRIMRLLSVFSKNVSYGLPIGGPASRILAELAINSVDYHLKSRQVGFCRYADDYSIFCNSKADAYTALVLLSEKLFNEGFVLQKSKTRILATAEFLNNHKMLDPKAAALTDEEKLLNISIRFDPYSETASEDYETLAAAVQQVNVLGILAKEIKKTAIDPTVAKQAINAIRAMAPREQEGALRTLLDQSNLDVLSPVFVTLMRAVRGVYDGLGEGAKDRLDEMLVRIFDEHAHILSVELNLAFYLQAISKRHSNRKVEIMVWAYERWPSPIIRRIVIAAMSNWHCDFWLSDIRRNYASLHPWEKRSIIMASYVLTDEGSNWRKSARHTWNQIEKLVCEWYSNRFQTQKDFPT